MSDPPKLVPPRSHWLRVSIASALLFAALSVQRVKAWSPVVCESDPSRAIYFGGDGSPWPLATRDNISAPMMETLHGAESLWNGVDGAHRLIDIQDLGVEACQLPDESGYSLVGFDDGTCSEQLRFDWWGGNANGVRQYWVEDCRIVNESIYFNPHDPNSDAELGDVVLHELGHHLGYAHNWFDVSVMGYGVHMYWYLTSQDQGFMRWRYPDQQPAAADVHLHRTVLLSAVGEEMRPGRHSQTLAPEPSCSGGDCAALHTGETVSLMMTYGNTGGSDANQPVRISMTLRAPGGVSQEIGAWMAGPLPAHSYNTYVFEALVPAGIAAGRYDLRLEIDSEGVIPASSNPNSTRYREFTGFEIVDAECTMCDAPGADAGPSETVLLPVVNQPGVQWEGDLDGAPRSRGCAVMGHTSSKECLLSLLLLATLLARRRG